MFGIHYIAINDNVSTGNSEGNDPMLFKNLFNEWYIRIPAGGYGRCSGPRRSAGNGSALRLPQGGPRENGGG